jgi:hypothetical protein
MKLRELNEMKREKRIDLYDSGSLERRERGLGDQFKIEKDGRVKIRYGSSSSGGEGSEEMKETEEFVDKGIRCSVKMPQVFRSYIRNKFSIKDS